MKIQAILRRCSWDSGHCNYLIYSETGQLRQMEIIADGQILRQSRARSIDLAVSAVWNGYEFHSPGSSEEIYVLVTDRLTFKKLK